MSSSMKKAAKQPTEFHGKLLSTRFNEKYGIDIAFEGGEAETLAIDGPIFKKKIKILKYKKEKIQC